MSMNWHRCVGIVPIWQDNEPLSHWYVRLAHLTKLGVELARMCERCAHLIRTKVVLCIYLDDSTIWEGFLGSTCIFAMGVRDFSTASKEIFLMMVEGRKFQFWVESCSTMHKCCLTEFSPKCWCQNWSTFYGQNQGQG